MTAAAEHLTALMAETFIAIKTLENAHPYIRALFAWHAIEEMEHRDVAFDVMRQVGEVPESTRRFVLVLTTVLMFGFTLYRTNIMLKCDGFSPRERLLMNLKGLPWFFGKNGTLTAMKNNIWIGLKDFHQASILLFVSILFGLKHSKRQMTLLQRVKHFGKQVYNLLVTILHNVVLINRIVLCN